MLVLIASLILVVMLLGAKTVRNAIGLGMFCILAIGVFGYSYNYANTHRGQYVSQ